MSSQSRFNSITSYADIKSASKLENRENNSLIKIDKKQKLQMRYEKNQSRMSLSNFKEVSPIPIVTSDSAPGLEMRIFDLENQFDKRIAMLEKENKRA